MMKKQFCVLLAALLCCLPLLALAEASAPDEAAIAAFSHTWVNQTDPDDTVDIWFDGEKWQITAARFTEDDAYSIEFNACFYYDNLNLLLGAQGLLVRGIFLDNGTEDTWTIVGEAVAQGFDAYLRLDENGLLHWTGSGDAWPDGVYANGDSQDDGLYTAIWECGDDWLIIDLRLGVYEVYVFPASAENESVSWDYTCTLDASGALIGSGVKTVVSFDENGEAIASETYTGCEVSFVLDGGALIWNEGTEDAGQGLRFERLPEEEPAIENPEAA